MIKKKKIMICRQFSRSGFTLAEVLVGMLAASILALAVGLILVSGYNSWTHNNREVQIQQDASLAMDAIGRRIREAERGSVEVVDGGITLKFSSFTNITWSGNQLILNPDGFPLVRDSVFSFAPTVQSNQSVDVILQLYDPVFGIRTTMTGTYWPRNL